MLHELILALSGYNGSVFVKNANNEIQVISDLPFIHPTEVALLNRLCRLATHYSCFATFIKQNSHSPRKAGISTGLRGLYVMSLCQGLDSALAPYRQTLLQVERQLLADPHLTVAYVQSALEEYQLLFPALSQLLDQIETHKAHGCQILEFINRAANCGIPVVKKTLFQIQHVCHKVLYKQLTAWMLHGLLLDDYTEMFIHKVQKVLTVQPEPEDDDLGLGGVTGRQMQQIQLSSDMTVNHSIGERFALRADMLPTYIPTKVAQKILFVGESVEMFEKIEIDGRQQKHQGSVIKNKETEFAKNLLQLSQQPQFNLRHFETVIDEIRSYVAEQLWKLSVEEADLIGHLHLLKDFFLLGRGELFLAFIDQAHGMLRAPPTVTTQHDVNMAFQHAARNVLFEDESLLQKFQFTVKTQQHKRTTAADSSKTGEHSATNTGESGWAVLNLTYAIEWPLHILFTPGVLERYNTVFRFLLYVKRVQLELQQCWATQMRRRHLRATKGEHHNEHHNSTQWLLRNHMAFLVDNLQYYLQVDVIESQFSVLQVKVHATRDFEAICHAVDNFLSSLLAQCFLLSKPISHCLGEILNICHSFCGLYQQADTDMTEQETRQLEQLAKAFQRQSSLLFLTLARLRCHQSSPHLAQLLLRIDYNKFFSQAGGDFGSYKTKEPVRNVST
ncbi:Gamma-tubulin complex component 4 [Lamellibrachia satsuma]|nr:Gamma-tubulin complex component 4 [Lamellibrachia satsuma]